MTTIETILARAMSEPDFAQQLIADADRALMGYDLTAEEIETFKGISRVEFDGMAANPENRKSFSLWGQGKSVRIDFCKTSSG